jgi:hypothetical protein
MSSLAILAAWGWVEGSVLDRKVSEGIELMNTLGALALAACLLLVPAAEITESGTLSPLPWSVAFLSASATLAIGWLARKAGRVDESRWVRASGVLLLTMVWGALAVRIALTPLGQGPLRVWVGLVAMMMAAGGVAVFTRLTLAVAMLREQVDDHGG